MIKQFAIAATALVMTAAAALAGQQYVDRTGFAVSGYDVVAYHDLEQSPVGTAQPKAVPGNASIVAEYNGAKWAFSTEENKEKFLADPAKFVPAYDGHCAYGIAQGGKVPGNPNLWRIVDGTLYLNITTSVVKSWEKDIPGYITKADRRWTSLEGKRASRSRVPSFSTKFAPVS